MTAPQAPSKTGNYRRLVEPQDTSIQLPANLVTCAITEQEYLLLKEGAVDRAATGARDVCIGIFATALVGFLSIVCTTPLHSTETDLKTGVVRELLNMPVVLISVLMAVLMLVTLGLGTFYFFKARQISRPSYQKVCARLDAAFLEQESILITHAEERVSDRAAG